MRRCARRRIDATNQRLSSLQRQVEDRLALLEQQAKSGAVADLATQIQLLQSDIAKLRGNAKRGAEAAAACLMCHRLGGRGVDYGPAIEGFASRQTRDVVITAIVNPSNDIAHGYEGSEITLVDGRKLHGLVLSGGNPLIVQSTGGVTQLIPASLVKERKRLGRSLMMSADQLGLSPQQIADITEYLK